jgi:hypothetical protein
MTDRMHDANKAIDANTESTLLSRSPDVDLLTRLLIGLLRQQAHDAGPPPSTEIEQVTFGRTTLEQGSRTVARVAENARAVIRKEFLRDDDAQRFMLRWSILPEDLRTGDGKAGDAELTVHPADTSRLQALSVPRDSSR